MSSEYSIGQLPVHDKPYNHLFELCNQIKGQKDHTSLEVYSNDFSSVTGKISQEVDVFKAKISSIPFFAVILFWAKSIENDKLFGSHYLKIMRELIATNIFPHKNKEGDLLTVQEFKSLNHIAIIDAIRCNTKWLEQKCEDYVLFFIFFLNWLSDATLGYISKVQDPDRQLTARRQLSYETYIEIITYLSLREKIIAKIFYLGGNRSTDEVLSLKIEDIDYAKSMLNLSGCWVSYPKHVLENLKHYIEKRKKGFVFTDRMGKKIDSTVPYRALKTVVSKLKFDSSFTFKDFGKNL